MLHKSFWGLAATLNVCCFAQTVFAADVCYEAGSAAPTSTIQKPTSAMVEKQMPAMPTRGTQMAGNAMPAKSMPVSDNRMMDAQTSAPEQLYTINNDPQQNGLVVLKRRDNGSLTPAGAPSRWAAKVSPAAISTSKALSAPTVDL